MEKVLRFTAGVMILMSLVNFLLGNIEMMVAFAGVSLGLSAHARLESR